MLFHTMIGSNDIERSKRFYDTVLGTLGIGEPMRNVADSGHTRLIYRARAEPPSSSRSRSMMNRRPFRTVARSPFSATQPNRSRNSTTSPWQRGYVYRSATRTSSYGIHGNDRTGLCPRSGRQQALRHSFSGLTR